MINGLQFAVFGLGIGAIYALLSLGLVTIFRGSGVLNLAHGVFAMWGAYLFREFHVLRGWSVAPSIALSLVLAALGGAVVHQLIMRPLKRASTLARVVATLGLLSTLQGTAALIWGDAPQTAVSLFPSRVYTVGTLLIPIDRLWLLGIAAVLSALLWAAFRYSSIGLAIRGSAENTRAAAALGWSAEMLATVTWALGSMLAAFAGILIAPIVGISIHEMPLLVIPITAAALIGGFTSFVLTFFGAVAIGISQSVVTGYVTTPGMTWTIPFGLIVLLLVLRGKGLPARGFSVERLPAVGTGSINVPLVVAAVVVFGVVLVTSVPGSLLDAIVVSLAWATIMLSVVVLLGFTSQLSFEQFGMAGLSALVAARIIHDHHWPFEAAFVLSIAASVLIGCIFALPALRTRGINLAIVTLGLAVLIFEAVISNPAQSGGFDGLNVGKTTLFGFAIDAQTHQKRYAIVVLVLFSLCAIAVANIRRGAAGNALIAVRTNERSAAALGINVFTTKVFAFVVGATVAGIGGVMLAFRNTTVQFLDFDPFQSVLAVSYAVIGGVGFVFGPIVGSTLAIGGLGGWLLNHWFPQANSFWLIVIGGLNVLLIIVLHPDGIVAVQLDVFRRVGAHIPWFRRRAPAHMTLPDAVPHTVARGRLEAVGITVRFGGVTALDGVSLTVEAGEVVGLIGPNGAGKTTLIDVLTGLVAPTCGDVIVSGRSLGRASVHRRVQLGLSRSFQALELFEQSSVYDNMRVACEEHTLRSYLLGVVRPRRHALTSAAVAALRAFALEHDLEAETQSLPYGKRRLLATARAIAVEPSLLLLDEPAAGLSAPEGSELGRVVRELAADWGMGVLVVEHDMSFVMNFCDRIVVLDFGRKIADGTSAEVRHDPGVIAAYLGGEFSDAA